MVFAYESTIHTETELISTYVLVLFSHDFFEVRLDILAVTRQRQKCLMVLRYCPEGIKNTVDLDLVDLVVNIGNVTQPASGLGAMWSACLKVIDHSGTRR